MSINELIATSSVHAFNSGVQSGRALEQERIVKIVERLPSQFSHNNHVSRAVALALSEIAEPVKGQE